MGPIGSTGSDSREVKSELSLTDGFRQDVEAAKRWGAAPYYFRNINRSQSARILRQVRSRAGFKKRKLKTEAVNAFLLEKNCHELK